MTIRTRTLKVIGAWNSRVKMKKEGIPQKLKKLHLEDNHQGSLLGVRSTGVQDD